MKGQEMLKKEELEQLELELEELEKACGGAYEDYQWKHGMRYDRWEKSLHYMIRRWKEWGYSYENTKDHILRGEDPEDFELILKWVDEIYLGK